MTDTELVAGLQRRDPEAYHEVVLRFGGPLHGYIYRLTQDYHLTDDILSETYLRLVEHIATYRLTGAPFSAWLYRIAHNLALNALKASRRTTALVDGAKEESGRMRMRMKTINLPATSQSGESGSGEDISRGSSGSTTMSCKIREIK